MSPRIIETHSLQLPARMLRDERVSYARVVAYAQDEDHTGGWFVELLGPDESVLWDEELDECGQFARQARDILAELDPDEVL